MNEIVLEKGLFTSIRRHLCLAKGHLDYPEGQVEVEYPLNGSWLDTFDSNQEKVFFSKMTLFNELSDPRKLYLSKIGPASLQEDTTSKIDRIQHKIFSKSRKYC